MAWKPEGLNNPYHDIIEATDNSYQIEHKGELYQAFEAGVDAAMEKVRKQPIRSPKGNYSYNGVYGEWYFIPD